MRKYLSTGFLAFLFLALTNHSASAAQLIGYWDFEESSGNTTLDKSGSGNDGTLSGASRSEGKVGHGLSFDGTGGVTVPHSPSLDQLPGGFTMEEWIKPTAFSDFTTLFYKTNRFTREFLHFQTGNHNGDLHIGINTDPFTWTTPNEVVSLNQWQHVAWTYDNAFQRIYVNGQEVFNTPFSQPFTGNHEPLYIGQNPYIQASNFIGMIDEARIYNGALSQSEITHDMNVTPEPVSSSLFLLGSAVLAARQYRRKTKLLVRRTGEVVENVR